MKPYLYSDSVSPLLSPTHTLAQNLHLVDSSDAWRESEELNGDWLIMAEVYTGWGWWSESSDTWLGLTLI